MLWNENSDKRGLNRLCPDCTQHFIYVRVELSICAIYKQEYKSSP